jgi:hypothetical protein
MHDDAGDHSSMLAADRERAAREQQQREHKEHQEIDRASALLFRQFQQAERDRLETERRRAMKAEAAKARQEKLERDQRRHPQQAQHTARAREEQAAAARAREEQAERAYRDYEHAQAQQRPAAGPAPTGPSAATTSAPPAFKYKVHACIAATSAEIARMIADSEARTRRLQDDLTYTHYITQIAQPRQPRQLTGNLAHISLIKSHRYIHPAAAAPPDTESVPTAAVPPASSLANLQFLAAPPASPPAFPLSMHSCPNGPDSLPSVTKHSSHIF